MFLSFNVFLLILSCLSNLVLTPAHGVEPEVSFRARTTLFSCSYYSNTQVDAEVRLVDRTLPWGSRVFLHYGLDGVDQSRSSEDPQGNRFEWRLQPEVELQAVAPFTWSVPLRLLIASRGSPTLVHALSFVLHVHFPNGQNEILRGGRGPLGFFRASFPQGRCFSSPAEVPELSQIPLMRINK